MIVNLILREGWKASPADAQHFGMIFIRARKKAELGVSTDCWRIRRTLPLSRSRERMTRNAKKLGVELEERRTSRAVRLNGT